MPRTKTSATFRNPEPTDVEIKTMVEAAIGRTAAPVNAPPLPDYLVRRGGIARGVAFDLGSGAIARLDKRGFRLSIELPQRHGSVVLHLENIPQGRWASEINRHVNAALESINEIPEIPEIPLKGRNAK